MRNIKIAPGEYYHIFNRAVNKQIIFHNSSDYTRFLFLILYFQSAVKISHMSRAVKDFAKDYKSGQSGQSSALATVKKRVLELTAFCIMPNHFHLIVKELEEGGVAAYMQRVLTAYSKYYNTKYEKSGHVFQGPYGAIHVEDNRQLLHLSAYIHRNPREIFKWRDIYEEYEWSSYQDFVTANRWGDLLLPQIITEHFKSRKEYGEFLSTSTTKLLEEEIPQYLRT